MKTIKPSSLERKLAFSDFIIRYFMNLQRNKKSYIEFLSLRIFDSLITQLFISNPGDRYRRSGLIIRTPYSF